MTKITQHSIPTKNNKPSASGVKDDRSSRPKSLFFRTCLSIFNFLKPRSLTKSPLSERKDTFEASSKSNISLSPSPVKKVETLPGVLKNLEYEEILEDIKKRRYDVVLDKIDSFIKNHPEEHYLLYQIGLCCIPYLCECEYYGYYKFLLPKFYGDLCQHLSQEQKITVLKNCIKKGVYISCVNFLACLPDAQERRSVALQMIDDYEIDVCDKVSIFIECQMDPKDSFFLLNRFQLNENKTLIDIGKYGELLQYVFYALKDSVEIKSFLQGCLNVNQKIFYEIGCNKYAQGINPFSNEQFIRIWIELYKEIYPNDNNFSFFFDVIGKRDISPYFLNGYTSDIKIKVDIALNNIEKGRSIPTFLSDVFLKNIDEKSLTFILLKVIESPNFKEGHLDMSVGSLVLKMKSTDSMKMFLDECFLIDQSYGVRIQAFNGPEHYPHMPKNELFKQVWIKCACGHVLHNLGIGEDSFFSKIEKNNSMSDYYLNKITNLLSGILSRFDKEGIKWLSNVGMFDALMAVSDKSLMNEFIGIFSMMIRDDKVLDNYQKIVSTINTPSMKKVGTFWPLVFFYLVFFQKHEINIDDIKKHLEVNHRHFRNAPRKQLLFRVLKLLKYFTDRKEVGGVVQKILNGIKNNLDWDMLEILLICSASSGILMSGSKELLDKIDEKTTIEMVFNDFIVNKIKSFETEQSPGASSEDLVQKYHETFGKSRQPQSLWIFDAKVKENQEQEVQQAFALFFLSILDGSFYEKRYDFQTNNHLKIVNTSNPGVLQKWKQPQKKDINGLTAIDTDDPYHFLLSGTEVEGSCQSVGGSYDYNKCLLGYLLNGQNRLLAVVDKEGVIQSRALLRLMVSKETKKPVLFLEPVYQRNLTEDRSLLYRKSLYQLAIDKAKILGVELTTFGQPKNFLGKEYSSALIVHQGDLAPYDYYDSLSGVRKNSEEKVISKIYELQT